MRISVKPKRYIGIGRLMIPMPSVVAVRGLQKAASGAKAKSDLLSADERKIHHFIVEKMAVAQKPITVEFIAEELSIPKDSVESAVDKLEGLKTFIYRSDDRGINWAYPLSLENTGHKMTASTGEQFFAA